MPLLLRSLIGEKFAVPYQTRYFDSTVHPVHYDTLMLMCYLRPFRYNLFDVCSQAQAAIGQDYTMPYARDPIAQCFIAKVQHGHFYSILIAYVRASGTTLF